MNWGHKITLVIIAFIAGMLGMVYYSFQQSNEMFDENYYAKEKEYQGLAEAAHRLKEASSGNIFSQNETAFIVTIPDHLDENISNGSIILLKVNDQQQDINLLLEPDSNGIQIVDKSLLSKGMYKVRLRWENNEVLYYTEKNIFIN